MAGNHKEQYIESNSLKNKIMIRQRDTNQKYKRLTEQESAQEIIKGSNLRNTKKKRNVSKQFKDNKLLRILLINFKFKMENHQPKTQKILMLAEQISQSWQQESVSKSSVSSSMTPKLQHMIQNEIPPFVVTTDYKIRREQSCCEPESDGSVANIQDKILSYNRKDKSLMELTRKFIQKFEGAESKILVLDQVTSELLVQRRRIYDIINIMESLSVVSKIRKNVYQWKGLKRAIETINQLNTGCEQDDTNRFKRQKSLQSLATEFLKLFSRSKQYLTLEQAAQIILSEENQHVKKTKIRRLYDIINVFKCLGLVEKVKISKQVGVKPMYQWLGCMQLAKIIQQKELNYVRDRNLTDSMCKTKQILNSENDYSQRGKLKKYQSETSCKKKLEAKSYYNQNSKTGQNKNLMAFQSYTNKPQNTKKFTFYQSEQTFNLRDISNQLASQKIVRRNSESIFRAPKPKLKKQTSSISAKGLNAESKQLMEISTGSSQDNEVTIDGFQIVDEGQSFFCSLVKILNLNQNSTISEIQQRLVQSIWPR